MPFVDIYLPDEVPGYPCIAAPRFNTTIQVNAGGTERRNRNWEHPLHRFSLPEAIARDALVVSTLKDHWMVLGGPYSSFPFRDPLDKATIAHLANEPDAAVIARLSGTDQHIGFGDGFTDSFQLVKTYSIGGETYDRTIHLPVVNTVIIAVDGVVADPSTYEVDRTTGVVTFDTPPPDDDAITAGFMFDNEVRYENDEALEQIVRTLMVSGASDLTLIEVRPC